MARSYDAASETRRARLSAKTRSDREVFDQTYRLAIQVMERRQLLELTQTELAEKTGIDPGRHRQDRAWLDLPEREDTRSPCRRPRNGVAVDRQADNLNPAPRPVSSNGTSS